MTENIRKELHQLWAERVEAFLASGLSQKAWCEQQGLRQNQWVYWLRKFKAEDEISKNERWISLDTDTSSDSGVSL